jgi:hypothetical protein
MGWSILDGMGNTTHLNPGTIVFNSSQGATVIEAGGRRLVEFTTQNELWDNYNHLFLRDASNQVVDTAFYTTDYGEDIALIRGAQPTDQWAPAAWKTPGQPEPGSTPSSGNIQFSELFPDAVGADNQQWPKGEWLELHNYGTMDVDLSGWFIHPSRIQHALAGHAHRTCRRRCPHRLERHQQFLSQAHISGLDWPHRRIWSHGRHRSMERHG